MGHKNFRQAKQIARYVRTYIGKKEHACMHAWKGDSLGYGKGGKGNRAKVKDSRPIIWLYLSGG